MKKNYKLKKFSIYFPKEYEVERVQNDGKTKITNYGDMEFNNVNPNGENVETMDCNLFICFVFKIVKK